MDVNLPSIDIDRYVNYSHKIDSENFENQIILKVFNYAFGHDVWFGWNLATNEWWTQKDAHHSALIEVELYR